MSDFARTLQEYIHKEISSIKVLLIGRIVSFSKTKMTADVQPLLNMTINFEGAKKSSSYPVLSSVPVNSLYAGDCLIIPDYQSGDLVYIAISAHDISKALEGVQIDESNKIHGLENAAIIGSLPKKNTLITATTTSGITIQHKSGNPYVNIKETGIELKSGNVSTEKMALGETLKEKLEALIDAITSLTVTCSAPGNPSSTPINSATFIGIKSGLSDILSEEIKNN